MYKLVTQYVTDQSMRIVRNLLESMVIIKEALILASTNPQYDDRFFMELPVLYMKTTSSEHVLYINCSFLTFLTWIKTYKQSKKKKDLPVWIVWRHRKVIFNYCRVHEIVFSTYSHTTAVIQFPFIYNIHHTT